MMLIIKGDCPSKKNSVSLFRHKITGKWMKAPGPNYNRWHASALEQVKDVPKVTEPIDYVFMKIYPKTFRKSDSSNKGESVMDLLVDAGIIEDDNWFVVPEVRPRFCGVDKHNPRVEVFIFMKKHGPENDQANSQ